MSLIPKILPVAGVSIIYWYACLFQEFYIAAVFHQAIRNMCLHLSCFSRWKFYLLECSALLLDWVVLRYPLKCTSGTLYLMWLLLLVKDNFAMTPLMSSPVRCIRNFLSFSILKTLSTMKIVKLCSKGMCRSPFYATNSWLGSTSSLQISKNSHFMWAFFYIFAKWLFRYNPF